MVGSPPGRTPGSRRRTESLAAGLSIVDLAAGRAPIRLRSATGAEASYGSVTDGELTKGNRTGEALRSAASETPAEPLSWALTVLDNPVATSKDRIAALWIVMGSIGRGWLR